MINKRDQTFEGDPNPRERIKRHTNNLVASGLGGLEHYHCLQSLSAYLTQYECKGNKSSSEWKEVLTSLNDTFCNDENNANKTVRSLIGKQMNEVMRAKSVSKDQSVFQLSGGKLKRTSAKYMFRCSLTSMDLNEFAAMGAKKKKPKKADTADNDSSNDDVVQAQKDNNAHTWENVMRKYRARDEQLSNVNVYKFCSRYWTNNKTYVPQFFGYYERYLLHIPPTTIVVRVSLMHQTFHSFTVHLGPPLRIIPNGL